MKKISTAIILSALLVAAPTFAQPAGFTYGPVFSDIGPNIEVKSDVKIPEETIFKVAFDVSKGADAGKLNRAFESAARFINMHVRAGVPEENIKIAIVLHGGSSIDVTKQAFFKARKDGAENGSAAGIAALQKHGRRISSVRSKRSSTSN